MLKPGDTAPDFALPDSDGRERTLAELTSKGSLILFFYPADFTPVCTREVCLFRDAYAEMAEAGITVAGVSPNDAESHARFSATHKLGYTLLADPAKTVVRSFGVDGPLGIGIRRATFLIDADRTIRAAVKADLRLTPHRQLIEAALASKRATGS